MKLFCRLLMVVSIVACSNKSPKVHATKNLNSDSVASSGKTNKLKANQDTLKTKFKVQAFLQYSDSRLSSFDILNDKTIALWNVVAGGGDAVYPSSQTKVFLAGSLQSLRLTIRNGKRIAVDTIFSKNDSSATFTINNTGCAEIPIHLYFDSKIIYSDTIPFHCGE